MPVLDPRGLIEDRVDALRRLHRTTRIDRAQLDVSGGVDSAVMLGLLAAALGPENVVAVHSMIDTSHEAVVRAHAVAKTFGVPLCAIQLDAIFRELSELIRCSLEQAGHEREDLARRLHTDPTVLGSLRSTLRAPVGRAFNRYAGGGLRHGTGNECEDRWLRFYQKGGDGEVDTNPLAMLSKAEVYQLGLELGVPRAILEAPPSPDLWGIGEAHDDEDEIRSVLGIQTGGHRFYGSIDLETGRYLRAGLIERLSRLDDELEGRVFLDATWERDLVGLARDSRAFAGVEPRLVVSLIRAARHNERVTRHKHNPALPTLGSRDELVNKGLLSDVLPDAEAPRDPHRRKAATR